jgi:nucleoside-diphosphate-sugar epimerase
MHVVTGGTGRLGSHLIKALLARGKKVKALVTSESDQLFPGVEKHVGDITKPDTLQGLIGPKDTVFHLAGVIDERNSEDIFYKVNVLGTENMLDACKGKEVECFVFVSSISVYGNIDLFPADENTSKNPTTKYGKSKLLAEEIVMGKWKKIPSTILRPGMIYGPGFDEGYVSVLKMLQKRRMPIIGSGENRIPLIHVYDLLDALLVASENKGALSDDFIAAGPGYPTQKELLAIASEQLGVPAPRYSLPVWLVSAALPLVSLFSKSKFSSENLRQLTRDRAFDCAKIKDKLGFAPSVPLSQGIKEMVEQYSSVIA